VEIYADSDPGFGDSSVQGAVFAFNVLRKDGSYVSWMDVEKTANEAGVFIRAGGKSIC
jgi:molybdenum cofactor sulfurtransferase